MSEILLKSVNKVYPAGAHAVYDFSLNVKNGEFLAIAGPDGCGKSSVLRMIAGLEDVTSGEIRVDGVLVNEKEAKERDLAVVLPDYIIYAHLSVYDNLAYGLKRRKVPREIIDMKVRAAAEILGLSDSLFKKPKALSGAQRLRVALGRIFVREPKAILFDEPLSNLDANLRVKMRTELAKLHARLDGTFIYVTRDAREAMTLSTRIAVMKDGFLQQIDTPRNLYDYPANLFVADYIGSPRMNFYENSTITLEEGKIYLNFGANNKILLPKQFVARIKNADEYINTGKVVTFGVRPEDVRIDRQALQDFPDQTVSARVDVAETLGEKTQLYCQLEMIEGGKSIGDDPTQLIADVDKRAAVSSGDVVQLAIDPQRIHLFDGYTQATMLERDEQYETLPEFSEDASFVPLTPQAERQIKDEEVEQKKPAKRGR